MNTLATQKNRLVEKRQNGVLAIWAIVTASLVVHIGSANSIIDRILNDFEYFKTLGFSLLLSFGTIFLIHNTSLKIFKNTILNLSVLASILSIFVSFLTYLYFVLILNYRIEGSTLFNVDIPLIFFICFLSVFMFRGNSVQVKSIESTNAYLLSNSRQKIQGYRANYTKLVEITEIVFFRRENGINYMIINNGDKYRIDFAMKELESSIPKDEFFRLNRQTIVARNSVVKYEIEEGRKLKVFLKTQNEVDAFQVSKEKAVSFKKWVSC